MREGLVARRPHLWRRCDGGGCSMEPGRAGECGHAGPVIARASGADGGEDRDRDGGGAEGGGGDEQWSAPRAAPAFGGGPALGARPGEGRPGDVRTQHTGCAVLRTHGKTSCCSETPAGLAAGLAAFAATTGSPADSPHLPWVPRPPATGSPAVRNAGQVEFLYPHRRDSNHADPVTLV